MTKRDFPPIHPGEILVAEFLEPMGISQYRLAKDIGVTPRRINEIVHGRRAITADTALRLGRFFNMEAQFWLNLQTHYDMEVALEALEGRLDKKVHPFHKPHSCIAEPEPAAVFNAKPRNRCLDI
jgi:antitoxin HigA-1